MQNQYLSASRLGDLFPQMENILQCGLFTGDSKSTTMRWSNGVYAILGIEPDAVNASEENFYKYVNPENLNSVKDAFETTKNSKTPFQIEFSMTNGLGLHKRVYAENYITFDASGKMVEYNGVIKDITESYYYKRALEQKITQLDKSNRNLQEFVYVASHDLQEPLRKISTFTERLNSKFGETLAQEGGTFVKRILASTKSMQTLLEDLLNFSRLSFDEKKFEKVSISECIESVLSDLEVKIEESKTIIHRDKFPEIEAYPSQITQLINNLVGNAIKFRKMDSPSVITIKCAEVDNQDRENIALVEDVEYVKIIITDNGIGFEQEYAEKVFMIFQRLNGKTEYAGSGVGLAICKKIVDNHHGYIFAKSAQDQGATFTILLPVKQS